MRCDHRSPSARARKLRAFQRQDGSERPRGGDLVHDTSNDTVLARALQESTSTSDCFIIVIIIVIDDVKRLSKERARENNHKQAIELKHENIDDDDNDSGHMNDRIIECRSLDLAKQESTVQWLFEWFVVLSLSLMFSFMLML